MIIGEMCSGRWWCSVQTMVSSSPHFVPVGDRSSGRQHNHGATCQGSWQCDPTRGALGRLCGLLNKREVLEVDPLREPSRQQQRLYVRDKLPTLEFGVSRVDLARLGRRQQRAAVEDAAEELRTGCVATYSWPAVGSLSGDGRMCGAPERRTADLLL